MTNNFQVKPEERKSWVSLTFIWAGFIVCIPLFMIGGLLGTSFDLATAFICTLAGYGIVCAYMCFIGMQSCDLGLPTISLAAGAMGSKGSKYLISLLLAITCIGWFGIQAAVCGAAFSAMFGDMTGLNISVWLSSIAWGAIMLLTAAYGYNAIKYLNYVAVPALLLLLAFSLYAAFTNFDAVELIKGFNPPEPMPLISGISLVVASFALGGVISGDYSRFAKSRTDVLKSSVIGLMPMAIIVIMIGAVMTIVTGQYDISVVLSDLGLPAFGLIAVIIATWSTNVNNAYSGGIAACGMFGLDEKKRPLMTVIAGGFGTILAAFGFMNYFVNFLGVLTALIPPVAGVMIAHYWIAGKGKPESFNVEKDVNVVGIIAFAVGAVAAYLTGSVFVFLIAPVNGIVISALLYIVLLKIWRQKANA